MALAVNLLFTVCPTVHVTTDPPSIGPRPPLRGGLNISTLRPRAVQLAVFVPDGGATKPRDLAEFIDQADLSEMSPH